jgi:PEP-CTERM motif
MSSWPRFISKAMAVAVVIGLATLAAAPSAQASTLDFSYTFPSTGKVLSGSLDGTLLSGGNIFDVTSVSSLFVNGVAVALPTGVYSEDLYILAINNPAAVSVDGSYMNLGAIGGSNAFAFAVGDHTAASIFKGNVAGATIGYGGNDFYEPYSNANWSASVEAAPSAVPEPGSFALLGSGVLGLVGVARRKFAHV